MSGLQTVIAIDKDTQDLQSWTFPMSDWIYYDMFVKQLMEQTGKSVIMLNGGIVKEHRPSKVNAPDLKEELCVGDDMICPVTKKHCDDECCPPGAICNLSGTDGRIVGEISNMPEPEMLPKDEISDKDLGYTVRQFCKQNGFDTKDILQYAEHFINRYKDPQSLTAFLHMNPNPRLVRDACLAYLGNQFPNLDAYLDQNKISPNDLLRFHSKPVLYAFYYNSNNWESSAEVMSLHLTKEGAELAMDSHKKMKKLKWDILANDPQEGLLYQQSCPFGLYQDWFVQPISV